MEKSMSFEDSINELEKIVGKLEKGELGLKESLEVFKLGIELSKYCTETLDNTEQEINILIKDKSGEVSSKTFETEKK